MPNIDHDELLNTLSAMERKDSYQRVMKYAGNAAWVAPEISYWNFASYEIMIPAILESLRHIKLPQFTMMDSTWNGIDSIASCVIGLSQLADTQTHRQLASKISGLANLTSGIQLMVLTILLSPFLPISFAAAAVNDFVLSLDPLIYAIRRHWDFNYWLKDSFYQLEKLQRDVITLKDEMLAFKEKYSSVGNLPESTQDLADKVIKQKDTRLQKMQNEVSTLKDDICCRLICQKHKKNGALSAKIEGIVNQFETQTDTEFQKQLDIIRGGSEFIVPDFERYKNLREETRMELTRRSLNTTIFSMAAIGWTMFCVPGLQIPATIIICITIGLYLGKNICELSERLYESPESNLLLEDEAQEKRLPLLLKDN